MGNFIEKYGPWALVTGAARGIGKAFAEEFASKGLHVILVDILENELNKTVEELKNLYDVKIHGIKVDLGDPRQVANLLNDLNEYTIGLFCCNHTASHLFPDGKLRLWTDTPVEKHHSMIQINLTSSIDMLHYFAEQMREMKRGGIILVSSGAAHTGMPYLAQYAATKAFITNLGETLWWELKKEGIDVITVLPGATKTPGATKFYNEKGKVKIPMMTSEEVVKITLNSIGKKVKVVPGWRNQLQAYLTTAILPRRIVLPFYGKMFSQLYHTHTPESKV